MQKWTMNSSGVNKVSLKKILELRPSLNEIECWALLGQTAHALQDVLLKANGFAGTAKKINDNCPVIYPERVLATTTGRIVIDTASRFEPETVYFHPLLAQNQLYKQDYSEAELEKLGIYSLGKTIEVCFEKVALRLLAVCKQITPRHKQKIDL